MKSCLYECRVMHQRFSPRSHRFDYGMFYFCLDLDEIDEISKYQPLVKRNRSALYSFCEEDFIDGSRFSCKEKVIRFVDNKNSELSSKIARVKLLTSLRVLGYIFNPVSIYYCFDGSDKLLCAVAEVTNTFREAKLYFIFDASTSATDHCELPAGDIVLKAELQKLFYVSPFSNLEAFFQFAIKAPEERLSLTINTIENSIIALSSSVNGKRVALNTWQLLRLTLCYPLVGLRTITLIHFQALKLFLKGLPFRAKEVTPHLQIDLRNPHKSLSKSALVPERSSFSEALGPAEIDKCVL